MDAYEIFFAYLKDETSSEAIKNTAYAAFHAEAADIADDISYILDALNGEIATSCDILEYIKTGDL